MRFLFAWPTGGEQSLTITLSTNQSFSHKNFEIQWWYVVTKFRANNTTVYKCDQKTFSSKRDTCFYDRACKAMFFDPLYLHRVEDNYVRYPTHTIKICCQKGNRLVVVPFAANYVFRIMEITLTLGHFLIFFQVWHLLSIWPFCSYCVDSILKKFINQGWTVKKLSKNKVQ